MSIDIYAADDIGVIAAEGIDAAKFLQGQLSNDVMMLPVGSAQLTALHTVQGRVQALCRLIRTGEQCYFALLPRELIAAVLVTLRKRVFRAKVRLDELADSWRVYGASSAPPNSLHAPVESSGRCLFVSQEPQQNTKSRAAWRALDIVAGLPQVYLSSQGEFVAQMLNLDLLGGIAFDKGCYIGQEIVARAHYRGRVKRRLQRFLLETSAPLQAGASVLLASGETALVVEVEPLATGAQELLAVATLGAQGGLPLPYTLPKD